MDLVAVTDGTPLAKVLAKITTIHKQFNLNASSLNNTFNLNIFRLNVDTTCIANDDAGVQLRLYPLHGWHALHRCHHQNLLHGWQALHRYHHQKHRLDAQARWHRLDGTGTMAQARSWVHISNRTIQLKSSINIGVSASTEWRDIYPFCSKRVTHQLYLSQPTRSMSCLKCLSCESSCQILSILDCKLQNKKCKGFPLSMGSDMGISLGHRACPQNINHTNPQPTDPISCWTQNENRKGFPVRQVQAQAYHLNIGLGLGLDIDLHY